MEVTIQISMSDLEEWYFGARIPKSVASNASNVSKPNSTKTQSQKCATTSITAT